MTINGSANMTMNDSLGHKVDKRLKKVWDTKTGDHWNSATECARELNVSVSAVYFACNKKTKVCKGRELSYDENVSETRERMANNLGAKDAEIEKLKAEMEALKADAELGRKTRLEQEAARKAEEKRLNDIAKADEKVARRQRMYDRKMEEARCAYIRLMEAKQEREAFGEAM